MPRSTQDKTSFCMSLKTIKKLAKESEKIKTENITKENKIAELLFDYCNDCKTMAAVPQGVFAVRKVRENQNRTYLIAEMEARNGGSSKKGHQHFYNGNKPIMQNTELTPLKYNSKLMNSIWGLYNRYSVHNFKKNTDSKDSGLVAGWGALFAPSASQISATAAHLTSRVS
ncbi:uncharacterized protein LOC125500702 [Athalia rosae]|uniref:uncharacterized protein LOC125500702 n=1 Tax=Athalia rosae TaxID=37344 RepID=UPI0020344BB3|nr:uncharacterized protein LOC125500702 [Athalia rosae]